MVSLVYSLAEPLPIGSGRSLGDVREKLRLAFDMYDMNKNGKVIGFE